MKTFFQLLILTCFVSFTNAQEITISGIVSDDSGPLPGANIIEKGTVNATTTNFDGHYEIKTQIGQSLIVSYVGYLSKEIVVNDASTLNVLLEADGLLSEVVVTAHGIKGEKKLLGFTLAKVETSKTLSRRTSGVSVVDSSEGLRNMDDPQSGQLTAAEVNDIEKWEEWKKILASREASSIAQKWQFTFENRIYVQVKDSFGNPANNTKVTLYKNRKPIMKGRTDINGSIILFRGDKTSKDNFMVQVYQGDELHGKSINRSQNEVSFTVQKTYQNNDIDIMFTVDATGSMGDEIAYLKSELKNIISRIDKSIEQKRVALTFYRDHGDQYVTRNFDFDSNIDAVKTRLDLQSANGGGDYEEAVEEALKVSLSQSWNDSARSKLIFLMLDAPPHFTEQNVSMIKAQIKKAQERGIRIIPVVASGANKNVEFLMRFFSVSTNGTYVFLTDDSGIGNSHIEATTEDFKVEKLNDLIVRLIQKYAGVTPLVS